MAGDEYEAGVGASEKATLESGHKSHDLKPADPTALEPSLIEPISTEEAQADLTGTGPSPVGGRDRGPTSGDATSRAASEWTASDARGPLNAVGTVPETEAEAPGAVAAGMTGEPALSTASAKMADRPRDTSASTPAAKPRRSLWPVAAGIVLGAIIGAGSAYYVYTSSPDATARDQQLADLSGRIDALDKKPDAGQAVAPLQSSLADLKTKVAAAETAAQTAIADAKAAKDAAAKAADATKMSAASENADKAPSPTAPPAPPPAPAGPDVSALVQKVATLETTLGALQQQAATVGDLKATQGQLAAIETKVGDVQKQTAAAQGDVQSLRTGQKALEGKITSAPALAVAADSLVEQIDRGLPFTLQVNALDSLGVDPAKIAVLRQSADQGVPSAKALADSFEPLTDDLLAAGRPAKPGLTFWDRMKEGVGGLVSVHRTDDVGGDDLPSHVQRIRADLSHDDVADAVATWNSLPAALKAKPNAAAWGALAKTHVEAMETAHAIERDALASFGAKKS